MGEATPAQSATGTFAPMLSVGMGSMAAAHGAPSSGVRGTAVPQLHSAIVERLRARIELCRRHHSTCEDRYRRGQAENSDREHESTLQLLNVVQQGPGTRKSKGGRGAAGQPPPDYGARGANGELRGAEGDHKMSTRIALQGSLRRKLEGHAPKHNSCGFSSGSDFKRVRLEAGRGLGQPCNRDISHAHSLHTLSAHGKNYVMPEVFNATLKEMKKEPVESQSSCGRSRADAVFDFKDEGGGQIDPELQDLFDELTKSVPPLNDLDLEKMLKQDDAFSLDLGRPGSAGLCSPAERPIKMERSPDYAPVHAGSPQLRPASAGPSLALTPPSGSQAGPPRSLPCWPEISHAEQLKQMAANQHQPGSLLHHHYQQHHQAPPAGLATWGPAFQDKAATRPRLPQQSKGVNNCLFKPNGVHHVDMKPHASKPTLHFSPKVAAALPPPPSSGHLMPMMAGNKTAKHPQQLSSPDSQNHTNPPLHFQNQQMSSSPSLLLGGALPFKLGQHPQGVPSGPRLATNGNVGQPRPPLPPHPLRGPTKSPAMHRQLSQQPLKAEKDNSPDQFSRHLTRPPPDYKRTVVSGNIFQGANPSQSSSIVPEKDLHSISCSSDHRFDRQPPSCIGQFPTTGRMAVNQNAVRFLGPNTQGNSFGMSNGVGGPHPRPTLDSHSSRAPGGVMTNVSWCSTGKPAGLGRRTDTLDSQQNHHYQQRPGGPHNQVAPDLQMLIREAGSRPPQPNLNQPSPEQRVPAVGNFAETTLGGYQSGRANRVTFDFLPEGDNTVPGINTDSDFIDSLLKSGSGNDDWMKDINLDEILGSHA
ncbi:mastermind-like protein 2 [Syngnathus acus]|uniref:mastermind-like protein 2 n=1 Tax=Syngnathus acus TaxID=161584 RepID=UPI0018862AAA|nr:mastermind-like protein 2 [Syngnathus acus]